MNILQSLRSIVKDQLVGTFDINQLKYSAMTQFSSVDKRVYEDEIPVNLCNYVDVYYNETVTEQINFMKGSATSKEVDRFKLQKGDVIITKDSESWDDIAVPAYVSFSSANVLCGYHLAQIRPDKCRLNGKYLFYLLCSNLVNYQFKLASTGVTRYGLGKYWLDNAIIPVPDIGVQVPVAEYLDRKTTQIDALITKKQSQIELLKEKRSALITQAVTKGLNPNVTMEESRIEWLGEMPKHWDAIKLGIVVRLRSGMNITSQSIEPEGPYPVFGGNGTRGYYSEYTHEGSYVLIGRQGALCGNINYATGKFWPSEHAVVVYHSQELNLRWMGELLRSMNLNQYSVSAAQPGLSVDRISQLKIPVPPLTEQNKIGSVIEGWTKEIDISIELIEKSVGLLHEYRSSLISEAVTGKISIY